MYLDAFMVNGKVNLAWVGSSGASYYNVKRASTSGGPYTMIGNTTGTSFTDPTPPLGEVYYVVTAVNDYGESANSDEAHLVRPPATPTGLTATAGNSQVNLAWNASSGADHYWVWRSTSSGGLFQPVAYSVGTSVTDVGVTNGTTYYYVVVAENSGGQSGNSNQASATPSAPVLAPTNLTCTAKGKQQIDLKWKQSSSPGVTQNRVYRSTSSGGSYVLRATLSAGTSFSDTIVASNVTYYYVVTAVNNKGNESNRSNQASATAH